MPLMADEKPKKRLRDGVNLHVYLEPALAAALEAYIESSEPRVSKTALVEALLKAELRRKGFWPAAPRAES